MYTKQDRDKAWQEFKLLSEQLGKIEIDEQRTKDSPITNVPKLFKVKKWVIWLSIITVVCTSLSFGLNYVHNEQLQWVSTVLINIGAGLVASIIILLFTSSRERNITYYNDIIPLLEKRYELLNNAFYFDIARNSIAVQNGDFETFLDCHKRTINTLCVIRGFYKMICDTSAYIPKYLKMYYDKLNIDFDENSNYSNEVFSLYNTQSGKNHETIISELNELDSKQMKHSKLCLDILDILQKYIEDLKMQLYIIKYSRRKLSPTMKKYEDYEREFKQSMKEILQNKNSDTKRK